MINLEQAGVPAFSLSLSADGTFRYIGINAAYAARTGMTQAQIAGQSPHSLFEPAVADRLCKHYAECARRRTLVDYEVSAGFPAGRSSWRASLLPMLGPSGAVETIIGLCHDFSLARGLERNLVAVNKHLDLAMRCLKGADWRFDVQSGRYDVSDNVALLIGESQPRPVSWDEWTGRIVTEDLAGASCDTLVSGAEREQIVRFRFRNNKDELRWAQCGRIVSAEDTAAPVICGVVVDVSDEYNREKSLEAAAHRDSLTALFNRRGFWQEADRALDRSRETGQRPVALFMLDLDSFKQINDRFGHATGDEVLVEVARRLTKTIGDRGIVARLGGDEFILVCPAVGDREAQAISRRIEEGLDGSIRSGGRPVSFSASVGFSWRATGGDLNSMMGEADEQLYQRKRVRKARAGTPPLKETDLTVDQMSLFAA